MVVLLLAACTDERASANRVVNGSDKKSVVNSDGVIHVPEFDLPPSAFLSAQSQDVVSQFHAFLKEYFKETAERCPDSLKPVSRRQCQAEVYYQTPKYRLLLRDYPVRVEIDHMAGVPVEIFTPEAGIAPRNQQRVLINLHGGGMVGGARVVSHMESIPIAALGRIKVVSVDYRLAPEYVFPAASEDVAAVYTELLKDYKSANIGIYGCSSGGRLTAQSVAWFQKHHLPTPGAAGIFCANAPVVDKAQTDKTFDSDSYYLSKAITGLDLTSYRDHHPYYKGVARHNPLASPGNYDEDMAKFPPTLIISSIRDASLSSAVYTHAQLVRLGVEADLHVWEGLEHAFLYFSDLPESREAYDVIVGFFDNHLGPVVRGANHESVQ